jgi:hypothetical protein
MTDERGHLFEPPLDELPPIPPLSLYRRDLSGPRIEDAEARAASLVAEYARPRLWPGARVAVGCGSRGLADLVPILRGATAGLRQAGADPFITPAMGSHGGGTASGQIQLLAEYGVTADAVGAPIIATDTIVEVGRTALHAIYLDSVVAAADFLFPVNRVKPHTDFVAPVQSGLAKMIVIGFGRQLGARVTHAAGYDRFDVALPSGVEIHRAAGRVLGGLASVENARGEVAQLVVLAPEEIGAEREAELLRSAIGSMGRLPFAAADVLVIETIGKDISGTGADTNVIGRMLVPLVPDHPPEIKSIVALALSAAAHGNALGIGLADVIPRSLADAVDWPKTWLNCFTAGMGGLHRGKRPIVVRDESTAIRVALAMAGATQPSAARVARITDTAHLEDIWISDALRDEIGSSPATG